MGAREKIDLLDGCESSSINTPLRTGVLLGIPREFHKFAHGLVCVDEITAIIIAEWGGFNWMCCLPRGVSAYTIRMFELRKGQSHI